MFGNSVILLKFKISRVKNNSVADCYRKKLGSYVNKTILALLWTDLLPSGISVPLPSKHNCLDLERRCIHVYLLDEFDYRQIQKDVEQNMYDIKLKHLGSR